MQIKIKAHFNKHSKDSKKELIQFYVKGEDERRQELNTLCREIVELNIPFVESLTAEFVKKSQDSKKTVLDFIVKGGTSTEHSYEFFRIAGTDIELTISESQMSIEEFRGESDDGEDFDQDDEHEGLEYKVNGDGTAELAPKELDMDEEVSREHPDGKVTELSAAAKKKLEREETKRKIEETKQQAEAIKASGSDDDLF